MNKESDVGYIAASVGGTMPTTKDIKVILVEDEELLDDYNKSNFDVEVQKYAIWLPKDRYQVSQYDITIPAGERSGRTEISVRSEGLCPDSIYLIPMRVDSYSAYEINPSKSTILYQVLMKNKWATQESTTTYTFRGVRNSANVSGTKRMDPLGKNRVRIFAGTESFEANETKINTYAITLRIEDDNRVTILPYKNIDVKQIDGDNAYPNRFFIDNDGFKTYKTFLLKYEYTIDGSKITMQEELRIEFKENEE